MAKRQFEIQGSTLRIGGVDLQAGTTGVVIPGVTQATNFRVEEVEETDNIFIGTFNSVPVVIDKVTYDEYVASGSSTGKATYTAELAGLTIEEIEVDNEGTYTSGQANTNKNNDLYAYTGSAGDPFSPFVSSDWTTIPFRPRMRAKDVETIGGGGGGATSLDELNNVNISDLTDGDMLRWDDNEEEWINSSIPTASTSQLGAVKVDGTSITIANDGTISAAGGGGGGGGGITSYKGFKAHYGRMFDSEPTLSKLVIYKDTVSPTSSIDLSTEDDTFSVTNLSGSDVVALFVIAGSDDTYPESFATLQAFVQAVIDNVILDGGVEGDLNSIEGMKDGFYNNFSTISAQAGSLFSNFKFYRESWVASGGTGGTTREGSGASFNVTDNGDGTYGVASIPTGVNYVSGHKIKILGSLIGGVDNVNDLILTVSSVTLGGVIDTFVISGIAAGSTSATYNGVTGSNFSVGSGLLIESIRKNNDGTLTIDNVFNWGSNYVVNDIIDITGSSFSGLASPDNDIVMTVTSIGGLGEPYGYLLSGTLPSNQWPNNSINDGGNDQYDTGNFINTDLASNIIYNDGNSVTNASEFGGGDYVVVYQDSIFGIMAVNASINTIGTDGGSGFDGDGQADTGVLFTGGLSLGDFNFQQNVMTVTNGQEDMYIRTSDDLYLEATGDDIHLRADDDIKLYTGYNFTEDNYSWLYRFNNDGDFTISNFDNTYGTIRASLEGSDRVLIMGGEGESWIQSDFNNYTWKFDKNGVTQIPGLIQGNGNVNISIDSNFTNANQLFRFRGGDIASHLHFDTSDRSQFDLYVGDDAQYVKVSKEGTIDIGTENPISYNDYTWSFDTEGQLNVPGPVAAAYTAQVGQQFANIPHWDTTGVNLYTYSNVNAVDRPDVNAVAQAVNVGWSVQVSDGNDATIVSLNSAGYFSFETNVPLTGTGTLTFTSPGYTAPQPTDLILEAGTNQVRLTSAGHIDHGGMVRTFKPVSASVGAGVSGTIWDTNLDVQAVKFLVHGVEATTNKSQSCEVLLTKDAADELAVTVYALVHTSANPLFTLDAAYNNGTGVTRLDASIPGANNVGFTVHVTAIYYD